MSICKMGSLGSPLTQSFPREVFLSLLSTRWRKMSFCRHGTGMSSPAALGMRLPACSEAGSHSQTQILAIIGNDDVRFWFADNFLPLSSAETASSISVINKVQIKQVRNHGCAIACEPAAFILCQCLWVNLRFCMMRKEVGGNSTGEMPLGIQEGGEGL